MTKPNRRVGCVTGGCHRSRASREILTILEIPLAHNALRLLPKYALLIVFEDLGAMHFSPGAFENNTSSRRSEMRETRILPLA